jgi:hypothetical protein
MRGRLGDGLRLALWFVFLGSAIVGLHALAETFPARLILEPGGVLETSLAAATRILGLGVGYWLVGSTVLYLVAAVARVPAALRIVRWTAITPIRRLIERVAAGALVASLSLPIAATAGVAPGYVPVPAGDETPNPPRSEPGPTILSTTTTSPPVAGPSPAEADPLFVPVSPAAIHMTGWGPTSAEGVEIVVKPGDHMWKLAEDRLRAILDRPVTDAEIAPYWLRVIGANLATIRSGDPDLIFPGEILLLPPIEQVSDG